MQRWMDYSALWWQAMVRPSASASLVLESTGKTGFNAFLVGFGALLYAFYGASMGLFTGWYPAVVSGLKLPALYLFTVLIGFPSFYVINCIGGPRLRFGPTFRLLLIAVSANAVVLASYAPLAYFFTLTTSRHGYQFLVVMHAAVLAASGAVSLVVGLVLCRAAGGTIGQHVRASIFASWGVLYAVIGAQMAWTLRPWIGSPQLPYTPVRSIEGSFFDVIWNLVNQA
ncbi:MAG: actin-binding WH2 domain-containing protein [Candidatus Hydrogenedentes bacterium]|nr:actin-binding WH2 domain-containing protein [Candidatus Hydrogenedentota bacterium]